MIKQLLTAAIFLSLTVNLSSQNVKISALVLNNRFESFTLIHVSKQTKVIKTVKPDTRGGVEFEISLDSTDFFKLQMDAQNHLMLILKPGDKISITTDANDIVGAITVKGSAETEAIYNNDKMLRYYKSVLDSINSAYQIDYYAHRGDSLLELSKDNYAKVEAKRNKFIADYLTRNPHSLAGMFLIDVFPLDENIDVYKVFDSVIFALYPNNYYVANLHKKIESVSRLAIGVTAPEISLQDTAGVQVPLSSFRGKVVLIDFWASWCGPCRKESPKMVELYKKHNSQGFEIYGVSLDKNRSAWIGAIFSDKLFWTHVSDLKYWQSEAAQAYGVESIPFTVLLDRDGRIIAKGLRGEDLEKKVAEVMSRP